MQHNIRWIAVIVVIAALQLSACTPTPTAEVEDRPVRLQPIEGTALNRVILTEKAAERLDIQMAVIRDEQVGRKQVVRGEVVASPATTTLVAAPSSGTVLAPGGASIPVIGAQLSDGQTVFRLAPVAVSSEGSLFLNLEAPSGSVLLRLLVTPGQFVEAGQALFEVANPSEVWVRVLINESDRDRVDSGQPALIRPVDSEDDDDGMEAEAIEDDELDDSDEPGDVDVALYYQVDNAGHNLALGQRVQIELTLSGSGMQRQVVPYAAVIYGQSGETWVFVTPEPLTFMRYPITIDYIQGDMAVLSDGPPSGTEVVTVGAAELYGSEFEFAEE